MAGSAGDGLAEVTERGAEFVPDAERCAAAALAIEDLSPSPDGLRIRIARSKTYQHTLWRVLAVVRVASR